MDSEIEPFAVDGEGRVPKPGPGAPGAFDDAQKALQAGDFAGYCRQIEVLQKTLRDLQGLQQPAPAGPSSHATPVQRA